VAARDYQGAETSLAQISERDLRGPGVAAAHQKASRCIERRRQRIRQLCLNTHELKETSKELTWGGSVACEVRAYLFDGQADVFVMTRYRVRHRLHEGQRVDGLRVRCGGQQRTNTPIRMSNQVRAFTQRLGDVASVDLEVLAVS
jgi:hypothetical protein